MDVGVYSPVEWAGSQAHPYGSTNVMVMDVGSVFP